MRKPEESLDDFAVKSVETVAVPPPAVVWLRFTGDVEVLKPLAHQELPANTGPTKGQTYRFSWFQSALAAAGAVAVVALVLLSAIVIGMYDPPTGPDVASVDTAGDSSDAVIVSQPEDGLIGTEEPLNPEIVTTRSSPLTNNKVRPIRSAVKPRPAKRVELVAYRPRRQLRRPQHVVTGFVPTTLVIYAENGEIKTRIEPQLSAAYKKPLTITN